MTQEQVIIRLDIIQNEHGPLFNYTGSLVLPDPMNPGRILEHELPATEVVLHIAEFIKAMAVTTAKAHLEKVETPKIIV